MSDTFDWFLLDPRHDRRSTISGGESVTHLSVIDDDFCIWSVVHQEHHIAMYVDNITVAIPQQGVHPASWCHHVSATSSKTNDNGR